MILESKDFASDPSDKGFYFGIGSRERVIAALLKLARGIADNRVIVQSASVSTTTSVSEFCRTEVALFYVEAEKPLEDQTPVWVPDIGYLYGFDAQFPIEIANLPKEENK